MKEENLPGISKIAVKGFKSIVEECKIEIRPLTILAGANSSGKSSIMQPYLMLKQTLETIYDPGPLLIHGPNVQFTIAEQFLSTDSNGKRYDSFQIEITSGDSDITYAVKNTFQKIDKTIDLIEMKVRQSISPENFTLYPEMAPAQIKLITQPPSLSEDADIVRRSGCFFRLGSEYGYYVFNSVDLLANDIVNTIHIPGIHGNPERSYKLTSTDSLYPGTFEIYTASVIHNWQETANERISILTESLKELNITNQVKTQRIGDTGIEVKMGRVPFENGIEKDMVNIFDVGFGVSQVLPVLVALTAAEPGQLVYIEQPELHLHPRAQVGLAKVLADAAKRGVRVVAETHSSLLLLGIQTLVAEGKLPPELVKLHWFSLNEDSITEVNSVDLDEAGTYGDWPVDFDDVDLNIESRYLDAVDQIRFGKEESE